MKFVLYLLPLALSRPWNPIGAMFSIVSPSDVVKAINSVPTVYDIPIYYDLVKGYGKHLKRRYMDYYMYGVNYRVFF